ncbi:hypothetical protein LINGRAHAP2_LOCUS339, partial [Linum grandiflorum]
LWLVNLPRKEDVERILRLRRWSFREWSIVADRWMPFAGRSNVASKRGILWLRLKGIPLHLRSPALFRPMGSYCGNFLNFDVRGCSWNSVRVKVKQEGVIPCKILLSFEGQFYEVKVTVEDGGDFVEGWRGGGSDVYVRAGALGVGPGGLKEPTGKELSQSVTKWLGDGRKGIEVDLTKVQRKEDGGSEFEGEMKEADGDVRKGQDVGENSRLRIVRGVLEKSLEKEVTSIRERLSAEEVTILYKNGKVDAENIMEVGGGVEGGVGLSNIEIEKEMGGVFGSGPSPKIRMDDE